LHEATPLPVVGAGQGEHEVPQLDTEEFPTHCIPHT
jgi:hypothetical protein